MKNFSKSLLALLLVLSLLLTAGLSALASDAAFLADAEFTVLTGSDFQDLGTAAFDRFGRVLSSMKKVNADRYFVATDFDSYDSIKDLCKKNGFECFAGELDELNLVFMFIGCRIEHDLFYQERGYDFS